MPSVRPTRARLFLSALAGLLLVPAAALAAPTTASEKAASLLEAKAASVVQVKVVLRMFDRENTFTYQGTVVDPSGMILTPNFSSGFRGVKTTVVSIRVVFAGDEKEHDAVLGAFDSKLGLGFVRIKDTTNLKLSSVDFAAGADTALGEELFGVLRMDEGFDHAPYFGTTTIVGQVQKPRTMWVPQGFLPYAAPLYHLDGRVAGVVIRQEGISESGSGQRNFLLPVEATKAVVTQALKASTKALEDAKAKEAEGAEAGMADEGAMADGGGMDAEPGMEDAPAGME